MRAYLWTSGLVFGAVTVAHILRLVYGLPIQIGTWTVPLDFSGIGAVVAGALCAWGLTLAARRTGP